MRELEPEPECEACEGRSCWREDEACAGGGEAWGKNELDGRGLAKEGEPNVLRLEYAGTPPYFL